MENEIVCCLCSTVYSLDDPEMYFPLAALTRWLRSHAATALVSIQAPRGFFDNVETEESLEPALILLN